MTVFDKVIEIVNQTQKNAAEHKNQYTFLIDALVEDVFKAPVLDYNSKFTAVKYVSETDELNLHGEVMVHFLDNFMIPTQDHKSYMSRLSWPVNLLFKNRPSVEDCQLYIYADDMIIYVNFTDGDNEFILIPRNYTTPISNIVKN
jgi:hypothetical protein